jgi:hypothetical protein
VQEKSQIRQHFMRDGYRVCGRETIFFGIQRYMKVVPHRLLRLKGSSREQEQR